MHGQTDRLATTSRCVDLGWLCTTRELRRSLLRRDDVGADDRGTRATNPHRPLACSVAAAGDLHKAQPPRRRGEGRVSRVWRRDGRQRRRHARHHDVQLCTYRDARPAVLSWLVLAVATAVAPAFFDWRCVARALLCAYAFHAEPDDAPRPPSLPECRSRYLLLRPYSRVCPIAVWNLAQMEMMRRGHVPLPKPVFEHVMHDLSEEEQTQLRAGLRKQVAPDCSTRLLTCMPSSSW
jgi:hypothetical protein